MEPTDTQPEYIRSAADAAALLAPVVARSEAERVGVLYLTRDGRVIGIGEHGGAADEAELPMREILAEALRLGADALVVAHSHPSGGLEPSRADMEATRELSATARNLGIRLDDHLVFAGEGWLSFREMGLL